MKNISFDGRIGVNGAEVCTTKGGKPYVRFSVANNSFVNGNNETEWFDVTSYDPYVIENRVKYLTKGTYVIIGGSLTTKVRVQQDGKIWVNQYVTATSIDTPSFGKKNEEGNLVETTVQTAPAVSTYTGGTPSFVSQPAPTAAVAAPKPAVAVAAAASTGDMPDFSGYQSNGFDDDDMPF